MDKELYGYATCTVTLEIETTVPVFLYRSDETIEQSAIRETTCTTGDIRAGDTKFARRDDVADVKIEKIVPKEDDE